MFKAKFPRELINEIKWRGFDLSLVKIYYVNRGSLNDITFRNGKDIVDMDHFMITFHSLPYDTYIPFHRIRRIEYDMQLIYER